MNIDGLKPVRQKTLSDEVTERLRLAIRDGSLPPGARLVEQEVAKNLAVSRIPVREAIQRLVEEGLIRKAPHRGAFVYLPSLAEIEEISSLRVVLERFVVERVMARWQPAYENALKEIVAHMDRAAQQGDVQQIYEQDYCFHYTLWTIADHSIMFEVVSSMRARISRFLYEATSALSVAELSSHVNDHDLLITRLKAGDVAAAKQEITRHVLGAKARIEHFCQLAAERMDAQSETQPARQPASQSK